MTHGIVVKQPGGTIEVDTRAGDLGASCATCCSTFVWRKWSLTVTIMTQHSLGSLS